jgi:hypothetical protein
LLTDRVDLEAKGLGGSRAWALVRSHPAGSADFSPMPLRIRVRVQGSQGEAIYESP